MMETKVSKTITLLTLAYFLTIVIIPAGSLYCQQGDGGTTSVFTDAGVGARALGLGGAFVALASDPTAVFWNPAGLDYIQKKGASFFYSSLDFDTDYNFVGIVFPTLSFGSFGLGWTRIGSDGIEERDINADGSPTPLLSVGNSSANQFYFSYAKQIRRTFSIGFSGKLERMSFGIANDVSDTGVGLDVGALYRPDFDDALLRDLSFGINVQNLISPRLRLVNQSQSSPLNFKGGLSKLFIFGEERNLFRIVFDFNKSENASGTAHVGAEYSFQDKATLRMGANNGQVAFGAGATYNNFRLDYNFGKFFDGTDFSSNHRFSFTVDIGKGRSERIRLAQEKREQQFRLQLQNELWFNAESEFNGGMEEGRTKYYGKDYLGAYVAFSNAFEAATSLQEISMRLRSQEGRDPEANMRVETANSSLYEAQTMLELANTRIDSVRKVEQKEIVLEAQQSALEKDMQDFILEHKEKGIEFFKAGFFSRAIAEWQLAVDRIDRADFAENQMPAWVSDAKDQLTENVKMAENQLQGNIKETVRKADALAGRGQYVQALDELNKIRGVGLSTVERNEIEAKIRRYQSQLTFDRSYETGLRAYRNKQWKEAAEAFKLALRNQPNNAEAKRRLEDAEARTVATVQRMPPNVQAKFARSRILYRDGKYKETLALLEEIRKIQPHNKTILDNIDKAREKLGQ